MKLPRNLLAWPAFMLGFYVVSLFWHISPTLALFLCVTVLYFFVAVPCLMQLDRIEAKVSAAESRVEEIESQLIHMEVEVEGAAKDLPSDLRERLDRIDKTLDAISESIPSDLAKQLTDIDSALYEISEQRPPAT